MGTKNIMIRTIWKPFGRLTTNIEPQDVLDDLKVLEVSKDDVLVVTLPDIKFDGRRRRSLNAWLDDLSRILPCRVVLRPECIKFSLIRRQFERD